MREYRTKVPYTVSKWRKGQRYVLAKYTTDDIQILDIEKMVESDSIVTKSHKILNMSKWLPGVIKKIMNENAMFVEEFSTNVDVIKLPATSQESEKEIVVTQKKIKTKGVLKEIDMTKTQKVKDGHISSEPLKDIESSNLEDFETKRTSLSIGNRATGQVSSGESEFFSSSCETSYVNKHYDASTFSLSVKTIVKTEEGENVFQAEGSKFYSYDLSQGKEPFCYVYKLITVSINSMIFGWVADKVKNSVRDMLNKFHERVIETEEEWKNISEEELVKLEEEMTRKFLRKS